MGKEIKRAVANGKYKEGCMRDYVRKTKLQHYLQTYDFSDNSRSHFTKLNFTTRDTPRRRAEGEDTANSTSTHDRKLLSRLIFRGNTLKFITIFKILYFSTNLFKFTHYFVVIVTIYKINTYNVN